MVFESIGFKHDEVNNNGDILRICPDDNFMTAAIAARDHFYMKEGLMDLEKFVVRKNIVDKQKAVATNEFLYREDMRMFWSGVSRMNNVW